MSAAVEIDVACRWHEARWRAASGDLYLSPIEQPAARGRRRGIDNIAPSAPRMWRHLHAPTASLCVRRAKLPEGSLSLVRRVYRRQGLSRKSAAIITRLASKGIVQRPAGRAPAIGGAVVVARGSGAGVSKSMGNIGPAEARMRRWPRVVSASYRHAPGVNRAWRARSNATCAVKWRCSSIVVISYPASTRLFPGRPYSYAR